MIFGPNLHLNRARRSLLQKGKQAARTTASLTIDFNLPFACMRRADKDPGAFRSQGGVWLLFLGARSVFFNMQIYGAGEKKRFLVNIFFL